MVGRPGGGGGHGPKVVTWVWVGMGMVGKPRGGGRSWGAYEHEYGHTYI